MGKSEEKISKDRALRWEITFLNIKEDDGPLLPVINWVCIIGERMEIGKIQASPNYGVYFKSEFNDTAFKIQNFEQAETIFMKFGLDKPKYFDEVFDDLFILESKKRDDDELAGMFAKLSQKWVKFPTRVYN